MLGKEKNGERSYDLDLIMAEVLGTPLPGSTTNEEPEKPQSVQQPKEPVKAAPVVAVAPPEPATEEQPIVVPPMPPVEVVDERPVSEPAVVHSPAPTQPEETDEDMLIYLPKNSVAAAPEEEPPAVIKGMEKTRQMPEFSVPTLPYMPDPMAATRSVEDDPPTPPEPADDQLHFDGFGEQEPPASPDWEQFRENREKKVTAFQMKLAGEEESNEPEEEPERYETDYLEDFTSYEDADTIRRELDFRAGKSRLALVTASFAQAAIVGITVAARFDWLGSSFLFVAATSVLLVLMMIMSGRTFSAGWSDLTEGKPSSDTVAAVVSVLALLYSLTGFFDLAGAAQASLAAVGGGALWLSLLARERQLQRLDQNFRFVGHPEEKTVACRIEDEKTAEIIGHDAVEAGVPDVAYYRPAKFLSHYLARSYERADDARVSRVFIPVMAGLSLVLAVAFGLWLQDWSGAVQLFILLFSLGEPLSLAAATQLPLTRAASRTLRKGGLLVGRAEALAFSRVHALVVDAGDLFPGEDVLLNGIKTFSGSRIDEAIVDAASVVIAAGGPLSEVFLRIIENKTSLLHEVETLTYEQEMGLSGWVNGRRVLVGNRRLLENHGVDVPSHDYEMRYAKDDRQIVYLSTAGELSAMFVVSYIRSESIAQAVKKLGRAHITLLVRTCDPNITVDLLTRTLGADDYYLEVLGTSARRRYEQLVGEEPIDEPAAIASNGRIEGKAMALVSCRRLRPALAMAQVLSLITPLIAFVVAAVVAFLTGACLPGLTAALYILVGALISLLLPRLTGV